MDLFGILSISNWLIWLLLVLIGVYVYTTWTFDYFTKRGINGPKPYPFIGTSADLFTMGIHQMVKERIKKYGYVSGGFKGRTPVLYIGDVDMMKQILVKEFPTFINRQKIACRGILTESVFDVRDNNWKRIRSLLTPSFSSGRMRQMDPNINNCATALLNNFDDIVKNGGEFEAKEYVGGYTIDVIATTAFGLQIDSQKDRNNEFVTNAQKFMTVTIKSLVFFIMFFAEFLIPLAELFHFTMFPYEASMFFRQTINSAIKQRQENDETRTDLLQSMMNAHNEVDIEEKSQPTVKKGLTNEEIVAQSTLFFLAGYETTASTLAFFLYNMATNQDVQDKLLQEIQQNIKEHGQPCYDNISKMTYLDMCINEILRLYPPAPVLDRVASKDITINGVHIPANMSIIIPVIALHQDPNVWPDPQKFDPDRFTPEAKSKRDPFYFLPFGLGPRQCIGMRLAQMEMKIALSRLLAKFKMLPTQKTEVPLKIKKTAGTTNAENGIHLKVELR